MQPDRADGVRRSHGWHSLERRLPLWAAILLLATLLVFVAAALREVQRALLVAGFSRVDSVTAQLSDLLLQSARQRLSEISAVASKPELTAFVDHATAENRVAAEALIRPLLGPAGQRTDVFLYDRHGLVAQLPPAASGEGAAPPKPPESGMTPLQLDHGTAFYDITAPVGGDAREPHGHLTVRRWLSSGQGVEALRRLIGTGATFLLGNRTGDVWTDLAHAVPRPPSDLANTLRSPVESRGAGNALVLSRAASVPGTPWVVYVELDRSTILEPMRALLRRFALIGGLVLALGTGASWLLSRSVTRPIRQTIATAEAIAGGDFSRRVSEASRGEAGRLARAFNHMTDELAGAREQLEQRVQVRTRELQSALAELETTHQELVRKEKLALLGQLASGVGHELRNPLAVMMNAVYYLELVLDQASDEVREYLGILRHQIGMSEKIVGDLLDFARIKPPATSAVELADLVRQQVERLGSLDGVRIECDFESGLPAAQVDAAQIGQVVVNLLTNAVQAVQESNGLVVVHGRRAGAGRVSLSVEDNGPGVPEEVRDRIFEPLFTTKARGIGLGLAVSKGLAEANGGQLRLETTPGPGAVFALELPTAPGDGP